MIAIDTVRASHRFVGPLVRLENELRRLADGESVRPIQFRAGDQWHSLADQFNRVLIQYRTYAETFERTHGIDVRDPSAVESLAPYRVPEVDFSVDTRGNQWTRMRPQEESAELEWSDPDELPAERPVAMVDSASNSG